VIPVSQATAKAKHGREIYSPAGGHFLGVPSMPIQSEAVDDVKRCDIIVAHAVPGSPFGHPAGTCRRFDLLVQSEKHFRRPQCSI
jgi:hypothetical protein